MAKNQRYSYCILRVIAKKLKKSASTPPPLGGHISRTNNRIELGPISLDWPRSDLSDEL